MSLLNSESKTQHSKFPRYDRYKDSGVEWLGEVPEHWEVSKAKWLWKEIDDRSKEGDEELLSISQYTGVTPTTRDSRSESLEGYRRCKPNDLAMNIMLAWQGGLGISNYDGIVSPAYSIFRLVSNDNPHYLGYLYRTKLYLDEFGRNSTGIVPSRWRLYPDKFGHIQTLLPPKPEQDRIVAFLDEKTAQIDELIAKKERQIQLLEEQKAISINQAVTRGLNPGVKLKDSGIEWIGEIPEHWESKPIKALLSAIDYGTSLSSHEDGRIPVLSMANIQDGDVTPAAAGGIDSIDSWLFLQRHDILFTRTNGNPNLVGKVGILLKELDMPTTFASYLVRFRAKRVCNPIWLHKILWSNKFWEYARSLALINLQTNLNATKYVNLRIPVPALSEQNRIAEFCEELTQKTKGTCSLISSEIESLKTLRSTLIAHAVTGKIKV